MSAEASEAEARIVTTQAGERNRRGARAAVDFMASREGAESIDAPFVFVFNDLVVIAYQSYKCAGIYPLPERPERSSVRP